MARSHGLLAWQRPSCKVQHADRDEEADRRRLGRHRQRVDRAGVLRLPEGCEGQGNVEAIQESCQWCPNDPYGLWDKGKVN